MGRIISFLENKTILVIGAAGFLSKILIEKILRTQPNVKKMYLLLRAGDKESANLRLQNEIIGKDLFNVLKEKVGRNFSTFIAEKVVMVPGDISFDDLGIQDSNLKQQIQNDTDVIVNLAANTNFDERYDTSLNFNSFGANHVVDFAKKCTQLKVLVHVSTAYVHGERNGLLSENYFNMGDTLNKRSGLDVEEERRLVEEKLNHLHSLNATNDHVMSTMKHLGIQRAKMYGWPNVYVFTKAVGEMLVLKQRGNLPVVIIRPTMVSSTFKEPFSGWIEGIRNMDSLLLGYGKGRLDMFLSDPNIITDVIPGDMVVNAIIVATAVHASQYGEAKVYHVGSSASNPITLSVLVEKAYEYFSQHPCINKYGKPVRVERMKFYNSIDSFRRDLIRRYNVPLMGFQEVKATSNSQYLKGLHSEMNKTIKFVWRLIEIYRPYLFYSPVFDDSNTERLRQESEEGGLETDIFYFDPKVISWEDYFMNTHIPGLVKYALKDAAIDDRSAVHIASSL